MRVEELMGRISLNVPKCIKEVIQMPFCLSFGPWLQWSHSGRWNKAVRLAGCVASFRWLNQAIKKSSLRDAVLPLCSAFHQASGRVKYVPSEGNVPYLCPSRDKFITPVTIYNLSKPSMMWPVLYKPGQRGTAVLIMCLNWLHRPWGHDIIENHDVNF